MPVPKPNLKSEKTINKMREAFPDLTAKIKESDIEVQLYITALEKDNLKLQRIIAKQRAAYLLLEGQIRITAEQEADSIIEESKLIANAEEKASERMKHISPQLKRLIRRA